MTIRVAHTLSELAPHRSEWDRVAGGCPFRSWTWLSTWWQHFGGDGEAASEAEQRRQRRLHVLLVLDARAVEHDGGRIIGILPCYMVSSLGRGRVLRLLGDGAVCSDHLGVCAVPGREAEVAAALAAHFMDNDRWDLLDFDAIDDDDAATALLFENLALLGAATVAYAGDPCWAIELPPSWDDFLALQSKSHRKQLRQAERRVLEGGGAVWHRVAEPAQFAPAWDTLVELHQRRRQSLGEPGCFASRSWASFHRDVAPLLLAENRLRLSWLELDGAAVAAEYHLAGDHATYAYQGGVDPARLTDEPGRLSTIRAIQAAIAEGHSRFDFLRGDEPYKAHWRATPRPTLRRQAAAPRAWPKLRRNAWAGARRVGQLARQVSTLFDK